MQGVPSLPGDSFVRRPTSTEHRFDPTGVDSSIDVRGYRYDGARNKTLRRSASAGGHESRYTYDSANRLLSSELRARQRW
ncbi:MAG: YD repeat-containing protein [Planctomycetota bacterium]|jgi:YD repeat-containing protein